MIALDDPRRPVPMTALEQRGGFAWWYAEVLDETASGVVLIWSYGLPFLPGYASRARRGQPQRPSERPSLNVVAYERGVASAYCLRELDPGDTEWSHPSSRAGAMHGGEERWRFGATHIRLWDDGGRRRLQVALDCPVTAGGPSIVGSIELEGALPRPAQDAWLGDAPGPKPESAAAAAHLWTPLALPAWGRARIGQSERVFYGLWPEGGGHGSPRCVALEIGPDGTTRLREDVRLTLIGAHRTGWGMPAWERVVLVDRGGRRWLDVELRHRVDHGPFYLRWLTRAHADGAPALGVGTAEVIVPARIDLARHRALVRMRVGSDQRPESSWLPLFAGSRGSRVARLLRSLCSRPTPHHTPPQAQAQAQAQGDLA